LQNGLPVSEKTYVKYTAQAIRNEHLNFIDVLCGRGRTKDFFIKLSDIKTCKR
jgi:hypothetical protein